jgi:hypothetical protein
MKQLAKIADGEFEGVPVGRGRYRVKLSNCGNPDYGQDCRRALPDTFCGWARVESLEAAATLCRVYLSYFELGGGNWTGGEVADMEQGGLIVGQVSFNGRVWSPDGNKEICV